MNSVELQQAIDQALDFQRAGRLDEAEDIYRGIIIRDANQPGVLNNLANILMGSGRIEESVELCRRALELDPANAAIHSSVCYKLLFHPDSDRASIFQEQARWNQRHGRREPVPRSRLTVSNRRLRIGYVSPDFYGHAECFFVIPLLKSHDRKQFEIHCYSSVQQEDKATALIRSSADKWHEVRKLTDDQLAVRIAADQIDVLVDLSMHMAFNRLPMFALKPAPIQVTWLAYPGGTGLDAIDYRLTDAWIDPTDMDEFYSERSIRLPKSWICYHPLGDVPPAAERNNGPIMFGCLNNAYKLNRPTIALWIKLLSSIDDSRLLLLVGSDRQRQQIRRDFAARGLDPDRIEFSGYLRRGEYLRVYDRIDICLDPLVYNGITTTCDALWMGVPVITRAGPTAAGRAGLSILANVEMPELVAASDEQFIEIAGNLAADFPRRCGLRISLRDRMCQSPLMNAARFTRNVEAAYRQMVASHPV